MSQSDPQHPSRRMLLKRGAALSTLAITGVAGLTVPSVSFAAALSKEGGLRANGTKTYAKKVIHCLN